MTSEVPYLREQPDEGRPVAGRAERQEALWAAYLAAARELTECEEQLARDESELRALRSEPVPLRTWHLRAAAETGSSLEHVLTHDRDERVSELELVLEAETEMRNRAMSKAWEALWDATHPAESDADSLSRVVAQAAEAGITASLADAQELVRAFTEQIRDLKQGAPIPVTAWHLRAAAEYGQSMGQVIADEREAMITARVYWIRELTRAVTDGEEAVARRRSQDLERKPRGLPRKPGHDRSRGASRG